jgi:hypothetical protein
LFPGTTKTLPPSPVAAAPIAVAVVVVAVGTKPATPVVVAVVVGTPTASDRLRFKLSGFFMPTRSAKYCSTAHTPRSIGVMLSAQQVSNRGKASRQMSEQRERVQPETVSVPLLVLMQVLRVEPQARRDGLLALLSMLEGLVSLGTDCRGRIGVGERVAVVVEDRRRRWRRRKVMVVVVFGRRQGSMVAGIDLVKGDWS